MATSTTSSAAAGNPWALPIFMTHENKWPVGVAVFVVTVGLYLASNHVHLFPPQLLPMSWVDLAVPFLPNTVWVYMSEYFFFMFVYAHAKDMANFNKYIYSFSVMNLISVIIFWFWPTTYPRDGFPLPADLNAVTHWAFTNLRQSDSPANCCPSLHVSSVYLSAFIFLDDQRKKFPFFFIWGTAVAVSTLTTKQHYLIDVVAGFLLAFVHYWFFHKIVPYRAGAHAKR